MDYIAESKNLKVSPRKVRLVVDSIRELDINQALSILNVLPKRAAVSIKKTISSAMANASHNFKVNADTLMIKEIIVNEGITYKRFHFAGRGRTRPYKKRSSHLKVVLTSKNEIKNAPAITEKEVKVKSQKSKVKTTIQK